MSATRQFKIQVTDETAKRLFEMSKALNDVVTPNGIGTIVTAEVSRIRPEHFFLAVGMLRKLADDPDGMARPLQGATLPALQVSR